MHDTEIQKHELGAYIDLIQSVSKRCLIGVPTEDQTGSYFGGMPIHDRPFEWPRKDSYPLHFVGQLKCSDIDLLPINDGLLLFFYDNRHWGNAPKDRGHAVVLRQHGERQATDADLPTCEVKSFFGLRKRQLRPTVYEHVNVSFQKDYSYPSLERDLLAFNDDVVEECYLEFSEDLRPLIQIGGFPSAIQSDIMEQDCVNAFDFGQPQDWLLLLQLFEVGDMQWGDAGALYWFVHKDDLQTGRFDRVWMVTQCH